MTRTLAFAALFAIPLLSSAACADSNTGEPIVETTIETTIEKLVREPEAYRGKLVRVRGVLDECVSLNCQFCAAATLNLPEDDQACIGPIFQDQSAARADDEYTSAVSRASDQLDELYRFSELTVEGVYTPGITEMPDGKILVCGDRCVEMVVSTVVRVHRRWPASHGTFHMYEGEPLTPMSPARSDEMLATHAIFAAAQGDKPRARSRYQTYWSPGDDGKPSTRFGALCICIEDSCEGQWPTKTGHTLKSPNNPYPCLPAALIDGRWSF